MPVLKRKQKTSYLFLNSFIFDIIFFLSQDIVGEQRQ